MNEIYEYLDYRIFLKDYYVEHKTRNPSFSYGAFARLAKFKSKGLLHDVLSGKKSLSKESAFRIAEAMKLDEKAISYFQLLVDYGQATTLKEKSFLFRKLGDTGPLSKVRQLREDGYEFYSQWYYHTLLEVLPLIRFRGDYEALGQMLNPPISAKQARKGMELLLQLGLIVETRTGFQLSDKLLSSGEDVQAMALRDFHLQNLEMAARAIDSVARPDRDLSCLVVALSKPGFIKVSKEIAAFRKRIMKLSTEDENPSRIYHLGFLAYPTSDELPTAKGLRR
jgi:uncharacterized protein (TIGR02147 family)